MKKEKKKKNKLSVMKKWGKDKRVYRFLRVLNFSDTQIFQGNNSSRFFILVNTAERENKLQCEIQVSISRF